MNLLVSMLSLLAVYLLWIYAIKFYYKKDKRVLGFLLEITFIGGLYSSLLPAYINEWSADVTQVILNPFIREFILNMMIGLNEEFLKIAAVAYIIFRHRKYVRNYDGMIFGIMIGLGFSFYENIFYVTKYGADILKLRAFTAIPGHMIDGAIWGYGLTAVNNLYIQHKRYLFFLKIAPYFLLGSFFHGLYDYILYLKSILDLNMGDKAFDTLFIILPFIGVLLVFIYVEIRRLYKKQEPIVFTGICMHCGTAHMTNDNFCRICGKSIEKKDELHK